MGENPCPYSLGVLGRQMLLGMSKPPPGPHFVLSFSECSAASEMPKTENLLSLASVRPRDLRLPLVHRRKRERDWLWPCGKRGEGRERKRLEMKEKR